VANNNLSLLGFFKKRGDKTKRELKKCVIIMDEVDGMTGDRGGIVALVD